MTILLIYAGLALSFLLVVAIGVYILVSKRLPSVVLSGGIVLWGVAKWYLTDDVLTLLIVGSIVLLNAVAVPFMFSLWYRVPKSLLDAPPVPEVYSLIEHPSLSALSVELSHQGFRYVGETYVWGKDEKAVQRIFLSEDGRTLAHASYTPGSIGGSIAAITLASESGAQFLQTSTWRSMHPWPLPSGWVIFYHHFCSHAEELVRLHRQHVGDLLPGELRVWSPSEAVPRLRRQHEEELAVAVEKGWVTDDGADAFRPTLKGAFGVAFRGSFTQYRRSAYRMG